MSARTTRHIDRPFLGIILTLLFVGFIVFSSASLGLLTRSDIQLSSLLISQLFLGIGGGLAALFVLSNIHYRVWKKYSLYIFLATAVMALLVFVPFLGFSSGGATRWLSLGPISVQPAEFLKIGFVLYMATYLSNLRSHLHAPFSGIVAFVLILAVPAVILLLQPDTSTLVVIAGAAGAMFFAAGSRWRDIGIVIILALLAFAALAVSRPYVLDRVTTFLNPTEDQLGSGYQIKQSLIAVGSGGIAGRGFGQSVQKFGYLPEPIGDSIFAVASEEFGFLGSTAIIGLFLAFLYRAIYIAVRAPDYFGALVVIGLTLLVIVQAFVNIASMLGVIPLTGLPLPFISHGGTAMLATLAAMGIVLNVSRYIKN